jgi:hypothetical protein
MSQEVKCAMFVLDRPTNESVERIRAEYLEMPGLCLTKRQMGRLCLLDASVCDAAVEELIASGFLKCRTDNTFVRAQ